MDHAQTPPVEQINSISDEKPFVPEYHSITDANAAPTAQVQSIAPAPASDSAPTPKVVDLSQTKTKTIPVSENATSITKKADEEENDLIENVEHAHEQPA